MCDNVGMFEHADHAVPRPSHGYCTDDMARLLVVVAREPEPSQQVVVLGSMAIRFLAGAQGGAGHVRNRRGPNGRWHGRRGVEDCWGRSLWAFGVAVEHRRDWMARDALTYFDRGTERRSPWPRSMAYAALGAGAVLRAQPRSIRARALLSDAAELIGRPAPDDSWPWPEPRLTYGNALLPHALLEAGVALDRPQLVEDGLRLLGWLLDRETGDGHLSVTPAGGSGPGALGGFDQQPIEVATLADACTFAARLTGDPRWSAGVGMAAAWFDGDNDTGTPVWDPVTGGSYDGLEATGVNLNQGAESTIALVATRQQAQLVGRATA